MKAGIDRIEGTIAVLIPMEDESLQLTVPLKLLPTGCREGDILTFEIQPDRQATKAAKKRVLHLVEKLKKTEK